MNATLLKCTNCQSPLPPAAVDRHREIATCRNCGRLVDVREQLRPPETPSSTGVRMRPPVELPSGMTIEPKPNAMVPGAPSPGVTIRRRWLRGKHWIFLMVLAGLTVGLINLWMSRGATALTVIGTLLLFAWDYNVTAMFVNSTSIRANARGVEVRHGPLPSLFGKSRSVPRERLKQLFATTHGNLFAVAAHLTDGSTLVLVAPLVSAEQALFVEQQLEKELGLVDFAVAGELGHEQVSVDGRPVPGAKPGAAVALAVPAIVAGALAMVFLMGKTEVAGQLEATPPVGSWVFAPDDCSSGQHEGFGGVSLTSSKEPGRTVRIVSDPVKGQLLVVADAGAKNRVFDSETCSVLALNVERTNTKFNDIWVVQGIATVKCPGLAGNLSFAGCH